MELPVCFYMVKLRVRTKNYDISLRSTENAALSVNLPARKCNAGLQCDCMTSTGYCDIINYYYDSSCNVTKERINNEHVVTYLAYGHRPF